MPEQEKATFKAVGNFMMFLFTLTQPFATQGLSLEEAASLLLVSSLELMGHSKTYFQCCNLSGDCLRDSFLYPLTQISSEEK